jgi:hemerythrin
MPMLNWNDKLSVGIASIDEEHKKLVKMLNDLYDGIMSGHGKDVLGNILDSLIDYTKVHFAHEEKFFAQTGYQEAAAHKHEHEALTKQVVEIQGKYKSGAISTLSIEVMQFLKNWLVKHIQIEDKKYGPHLISKGVH